MSWLWLFALGLLMLGTVCYVVDALTRFLAPSFADTSATIFLLPEIVCEVSLLAYLLTKGVRTPHPAAHGPATA